MKLPLFSLPANFLRLLPDHAGFVFTSKIKTQALCIFALSMINNHIIELARKLWDYHHMHHTLEKTDCILVLGSHDLRVAQRGAELYLQGWAPLLIFSGGLGNFTQGM